MENGFLGSLRLVGFTMGIACAFIALPGAYEATWPWLSAHVIGGYSAGVRSWSPFFWSCILFLLIFAIVRAALFLLVSIGGLLIALWLIFRRWWK